MDWNLCQQQEFLTEWGIGKSLWKYMQILDMQFSGQRNIASFGGQRHFDH